MKNNIFNFIKKSYVLIILFLIYTPLVLLVVWSFVQPSDKNNVVMNPEEGNGWGFGSYLQLFVNNEFLNGLLNTFIIISIVSPISVFIATITCYSIWNNRKFVNHSTNFITRISIVNPEIITAISLTLLLSSTWIAIGCDFGFFTIILSHISFCTPYAIITIYPRMAKFKKNLLDASNDLGYNSFQTFFRIVIPYLLPAIIGALALVIVMSFDDFIITNLVRGRINTISSEIYQMAKGIKSWVIAFGAILVLIFITFITIKGIIGYRKEKNKKRIEMYKIHKRKWGKDAKVKKLFA